MTATKPLLYLLLKNPFTERDYRRMGVESLSWHFEVRVLDCTAWLMPLAYRTRRATSSAIADVREIRGLRALLRELNGVSEGFAIDHVGQFCPKALLLFHFIKRHRLKLVALDSGAVPSAAIVARKRSFREKVQFAVKSRALQRHANALLIRLLLKVLPDQRPDFAFVSGSSWTGHPRYASARVKVPAHSFDYERALDVERVHGGPSKPYAVYLDENIAGHEDNAELGLEDPTAAEVVYPALLRFFDGFEKEAGMPVIIAGYPSSRSERAADFGGREFHVGVTAELIRGAACVFAHGSTAISFAVIWRKPLVFLTSREIAAGWYGPAIEARARLLARPLVDIDLEWVPGTAATWQGSDDARYRGYEAAYLRAECSSSISLWDIVARTLNAESDLAADICSHGSQRQGDAARQQKATEA